MGNTLGAATPQAVHDRLSETEIEDLWALFDVIAHESSGEMGGEGQEFSAKNARHLRVSRDAFMKHVLPDAPAVASRLFDTFATASDDLVQVKRHHSRSMLFDRKTEDDGDRLLDWPHFAVGMVLVTRGPWKDKLRFLFQLFDLRGDGKLSRREIAGVLTSSLFAGVRLKQSVVIAGDNEEDGPPRRVFLRALYPYTARKDDELTFAKGDVIKLMRKYDQNWWLGNFRGKNGYIPSNYVEETSGSLGTSMRVEVGRIERPVTILAKYLADDAFAQAGATDVMTEEQFLHWGQVSYHMRMLLQQLQQVDLAPPKMEITSPTNFRKVKGFTDAGGLDLDNVPAEMRQILVDTGYTKEILENKETSDMVLDILTEHMERAPVPSGQTAPVLVRPTQAPPPVPTRPAPGAPATPQAPLRDAPQAPNIDAPQPPIATADSNVAPPPAPGPPPAPPMPKLSQSQTVMAEKPAEARASLMDAIRGGMALSHVDEDDENDVAADGPPAPALFSQIQGFQKRSNMRHVDLEELKIERLSEKKKQGLMGILTGALESRQQYLRDEESTEYDDELFPDNDDEW
jgi:SH3 domain